MNKFNELPMFYTLGFYHPKFTYHQNNHIEENCYHNEFSGSILKLKDRNPTAVNYFKDILLNLLVDEEIVITTVPSHTAHQLNSGIRDLANKLVESRGKYINGIQCLERFRTIPKSSNNTHSRDKHIHLESIQIINKQLVENQNIILIDDIRTTGSSVNACKDLLKNAGAKEIKIIVLGQTIRDVERAHYSIDWHLKDSLEEIGRDAYYDRLKIDRSYEGSLDYSIEELGIDENDEERVFEIQCAIGEAIQEEFDSIDNAIEHQNDYYNESANEAHQCLNGEDYFLPNNSFMSIMLADIF
jgi:predicted amidophosphoribosyltransferase